MNALSLRPPTLGLGLLPLLLAHWAHAAPVTSPSSPTSSSPSQPVEPPYSLRSEYQSHDHYDSLEGSLQKTTHHLAVSAPLLLKEQFKLGLKFSYTRTSYETDGELSAFYPQQRAHSYRLALMSFSSLKHDWRLLTSTSVASHLEDSSELGDNLTYRGLYAAFKKPTQTLTYGFGFGFSTRLEDNPLFFPIPVLIWEFTPDWSVTTAPTPGTRFGPGLALQWEPSETWQLYTGVRYHRDAVRLADQRILEESSLRAFLSLQYHFQEKLTLTGTIGSTLKGELRSLASDGRTLQEEDTGFAPFVSLDFSYQF